MERKQVRTIDDVLHELREADAFGKEGDKTDSIDNESAASLVIALTLDERDKYIASLEATIRRLETVTDPAKYVEMETRALAAERRAESLTVNYGLLDDENTRLLAEVTSNRGDVARLENLLDRVYETVGGRRTCGGSKDPFEMYTRAVDVVRRITAGICPARLHALSAINAERAYQDAKWGTLLEHPHEVGAWLLVVQAIAAKAAGLWASTNGDGPALRELVQIAAVAVAALEQHGVPPGRTAVELESARTFRQERNQS